MLQKLTSQQVAALPLEKAKELLEKVNKGKEDLFSQKGAGKSWSEDKQEQLNSLTLMAVDLEEIIEAKEKEATETKVEEKLEVPAGTEHLIHLVICKGRRFNPKTGVEETKPYTQMFTKSELRLFLEYSGMMGYQILKVLHNPTDISIKID